MFLFALVAYVGIFISIFLSGIVVPIPEELQLLGIGYLSKATGLNIFIAGVVAFAAAFLSDVVLFMIARRENRVVRGIRRLICSSEFLNKYITPDHHENFNDLLRYILGIRIFGNGVAILAGIVQLDRKKFFMLDAAVLLVYVPMLIVLGVYAHDLLLSMTSTLNVIRHWVFVLFIVVASGITIRFIYRKLR